MQTDENPKNRERRSVSLAQIAVVVTLVLNFGALVWGASRLSATVETTATANAALAAQVERIADKVNNHETRISVIEATGARNGR